MRLLFLGLNYAPEPVGIGPYTSGLAEALAAKGHEVEVVTGQPYYPYWRRFHGTSRGWTKSEEKGVTVTRCPHYIPRSPTAVRRILHLLSFALSACYPAISASRSNPGLVVAIVPTLASLPVALLAAWLSSARLWVHVQDFEIAAAGATGLVKREGLLSRLAQWLERFLLRQADMVSSISPQMCVRLDAIGIDPERVYELRNWSNHMDAFAHPISGDFRSEWRLGERKVVLYSGNIANKQGLEVVIEAARELQERMDLVFVICGNGPNRERLEHLGEGLPNLQFRDLQPKERIGELLSLAFVHVLPQLADAADLVLPSKLANMLASGRPVIATAAEGTGLADEASYGGIAVPPGDARALAGAIVRLADDPALSATFGKEAARRAVEIWSEDVIVDSAESAMLRVVDAEAIA